MTLNHDEVDIKITCQVHQAFNKKEIIMEPIKDYHFDLFFHPFDEWIENNETELEDGKQLGADSVVKDQDVCFLLGQNFENRLDIIQRDKEKKKKERMKDMEEYLDAKRRYEDQFIREKSEKFRSQIDPSSAGGSFRGSLSQSNNSKQAASDGDRSAN